LTANESVYIRFLRNDEFGCTNQVAVFQLEKLLGTLVLVHRVVVLNNAFAIYRSLIGRFKTASQPLRVHNVVGDKEARPFAELKEMGSMRDR
jgi:hypothetical protein